MFASTSRISAAGLALALFVPLPISLVTLAGLSGCSRNDPVTTTPSSESSPSGASSSSGAASTDAASSDSTNASSASESGSESATGSGSDSASSTTAADAALADVLSVSAKGSSWSIEIRSPDLGCSQYADWWEVVTPEGALIYRRILGHSHVDEQPFVRSGGPVEVGNDDVVIVRAHMNPGGYGGQALRGSVGAGFSPDASITATFASSLAGEPPQPSGCAF